ncbi:unnamed protein product [Leptidea sinapis]|uniref:CWF21 domain-containing protein n=1 Tax=Leptidea sinapis TaxID=189913 RepID=A0A5E4PUR3_9NEOP|nr:unnamed protein product [Leptidea sinapis]
MDVDFEMYNGIGLTTPRGSGTNGYVQRNWATVRKTKDSANYRTEEEIAKLDAVTNKQPNREILDHERKRKIEVKCTEFEDTLEEQGLPREEIAARVAAFRAKLSETSDKDVPRDEYGRVSHTQSQRRSRRRMRGFGTRSESRPVSWREPASTLRGGRGRRLRGTRCSSPEAKKSKKKKSKKNKKEKQVKLQLTLHEKNLHESSKKKKKRAKSSESDCSSSSDDASDSDSSDDEKQKKNKKKKSGGKRRARSEQNSRESEGKVRGTLQRCFRCRPKKISRP